MTEHGFVSGTVYCLAPHLAYFAQLYYTEMFDCASYDDTGADTETTHWVPDCDMVTGRSICYHSHHHCISWHHVMVADTIVMTTKRAAGITVIVTRWYLMSPACIYKHDLKSNHYKCSHGILVPVAAITLSQESELDQKLLTVATFSIICDLLSAAQLITDVFCKPVCKALWIVWCMCMNNDTAVVIMQWQHYNRACHVRWPGWKTCRGCPSFVVKYL